MYIYTYILVFTNTYRCLRTILQYAVRTAPCCKVLGATVAVQRYHNHVSFIENIGLI